MKIEDAIKTRKFETNLHKATVNLIYTFNWLQDLQKQLFNDYDIHPQHYNVMRIIRGKYPEPITPTEIKSVMLDKGRDITRLVDKLVKLGYVERCLNEENRRSMNISLTAKGKKSTDLLNLEISKLMDLEIHLSEKEAGLMSDLLDKMRG